MKGLSQPYRILGRLGLPLLALTVLATGCIQKADVQQTAPVAAEPIIDQKLAMDDFRFPSKDPSLKRGKELFESNCMQCHANSYWQQPKVQQNLAYTTPIDLYLFLTKGEAPKTLLVNNERREVLPKEHAQNGKLLSFRNNMSSDDRWAVLFYARYLAGAGDFHSLRNRVPDADIGAIFGGNCAVCHGTRGFGDGPLHLGKTGNHEVKDGVIKHNMLPPPANFNDYQRLLNRTDAQLFKYICEGIYPSAMPSWYGNVSRDYETGKINFVFDNEMIWNLVRHVRGFTYENDLDVDPDTAPKGWIDFQTCHSVPTNQPWTELMKKHSPPRTPPAKPEPSREGGNGQQGAHRT